MYSIIDRIAALDAAMADLKAEREALAEQVKAQGAGSYEGSEHVATVIVAERATVDWKAVASKLNPSRQLVTAYTSVRETVTLKLVGKRKLAA